MTLQVYALLANWGTVAVDPLVIASPVLSTITFALGMANYHCAADSGTVRKVVATHYLAQVAMKVLPLIMLTEQLRAPLVRRHEHPRVPKARLTEDEPEGQLLGRGVVAEHAAS